MNRTYSERLNYAYDHRFDKDDIRNNRLHREIYDRVLQEYAQEPKILALARAMAQFLREKYIRIDEHDILLGHSQHFDYVNTNPMERIPIEWMEPRGYKVSCPIGGGSFEAREYWKAHPCSTSDPEYDRLQQWVAGLRNYMYSHCLIAHTAPGYNRAVEFGFDTLIAQAKQYDHAVAKATVTVLQGCSDYITRYAEEAAKTAAVAADPAVRGYLQKLSAAAANIAHHRPATYLEGLQLVWFLHEIYAMETMPGSMSFGRLDRMLTACCEPDLDWDEALLQMCDFNMKVAFWERGQQNIMIGGKTKDCDYLFSDVTKLIVEATRITRFDQPQISARVNAHMPDECFDLYLDAIAEGGGYPSLYNEDAVIEGLVKKGIPYDDALDFCVVGCVEANIPGKEYSNTEGARIAHAKVLELMLNEGIFHASDDRMPIRWKPDYSSFEEFYADLRANLRDMTELLLWGNNLTTAFVGENWPLPFTTALMDGCLESGKDAANGGSRYPYSGVNAITIQDTANALMVLKKLVFEEKKISYAELKRALANNFVGYDAFVQQARQVPKFGNDNDEVDGMVAEMTADFLQLCNHYPNPFDKTYAPGLYSVDWHATAGKHTMALPNGRKAGVSLSNGFGPEQGTDISGPTAVANSVCKCDLSTVANGMVLDVKFAPSFFRSAAHRNAFKMYVRTYFKKGGQELQVNVVDRDTLIDAQKHPENHRDLVVRVSGYSAYFHNLSKETQDEIIQRTEYASI